LWFLLYAQVVQADAASNRNVLLLQQRGRFASPEDVGGGPTGLPPSASRLSSQRDRLGYAIFLQSAINNQLELLGLPFNLPLSVLAVELLPAGVGSDLPPGADEAAAGIAPLAAVQNTDPLQLSSRPRRILRTSPLVPVTPRC